MNEQGENAKTTTAQACSAVRDAIWRIVYRGWLNETEELKPAGGSDRACAYIEAASEKEAVEKLKSELRLSKCEIIAVG